MAKSAVNLRVPAGTGLIQAGDRTVLAAMPYRRGRVVVASLGQWLQPGLSGPPDIVAERWRQVPKDNLPLETGSQRQLPLLANVVRWLTNRARRGAVAGPPQAAGRSPGGGHESPVLRGPSRVTQGPSAKDDL